MSFSRRAGALLLVGTVLGGSAAPLFAAQDTAEQQPAAPPTTAPAKGRLRRSALVEITDGSFGKKAASAAAGSNDFTDSGENATAQPGSQYPQKPVPGAVEPLDVPYFRTSFLTFIKKRGVWLFILFFGEFFTQTSGGTP